MNSGFQLLVLIYAKCGKEAGWRLQFCLPHYRQLSYMLSTIILMYAEEKKKGKRERLKEREKGKEMEKKGRKRKRSFYGSKIGINIKTPTGCIVQFPLFSCSAAKAGCRCTWKDDSYCGSISFQNQLSSWVFVSLLWLQLVTVQR